MVDLNVLSVEAEKMRIMNDKDIPRTSPGLVASSSCNNKGRGRAQASAQGHDQEWKGGEHWRGVSISNSRIGEERRSRGITIDNAEEYSNPIILMNPMMHKRSKGRHRIGGLELVKEEEEEEGGVEENIWVTTHLPFDNDTQDSPVWQVRSLGSGNGNAGDESSAYGDEDIKRNTVPNPPQQPLVSGEAIKRAVLLKAKLDTAMAKMEHAMCYLNHISTLSDGEEVDTPPPTIESMDRLEDAVVRCEDAISEFKSTSGDSRNWESSSHIRKISSTYGAHRKRTTGLEGDTESFGDTPPGMWSRLRAKVTSQRDSTISQDSSPRLGRFNKSMRESDLEWSGGARDSGRSSIGSEDDEYTSRRTLDEMVTSGSYSNILSGPQQRRHQQPILSKKKHSGGKTHLHRQMKPSANAQEEVQPGY
jgi:hypothetical protein